jgi:hypothetical protein
MARTNTRNTSAVSSRSDEAWDAPLLDARVTEPCLQMMLDHPVESGRLGPAWEVAGLCWQPSRILHPAIVVSAPGRYHQVEGIEVSAKQRVALLASGNMFRRLPLFLRAPAKPAR